MDRLRQRIQEKPAEVKARRAGRFPLIESKLPARFPRTASSLWDTVSAVLRGKTSANQPYDYSENIVWLFDNVAYQQAGGSASGRPQLWHVEIVACAFIRGRKDISKYIASIADHIGLDGELGDNDEIRKRIERRLRPLVYSVAPSRTMKIRIPSSSHRNSKVHSYSLGPTNSDGILSQSISTTHQIRKDRVTLTSHLAGSKRIVTMNTTLAVPEGWLVISDVDDSIKVTQTSDAVGILRTTFAEEPRPIEGMPEFYKFVERQLQPVWVYLSASPYNLYQFLQRFLNAYYHPGTLILRENSWHDLGGFLKSYSMGTQAYKADRIDKIHSWFPRRKVICVGDSTQSDSEAYAEEYRKYPGWIRAIYIRKVTNIPNMDDKNADSRFEKAFDGIPRRVWTVFERPEELYRLLDRLKT